MYCCICTNSPPRHDLTRPCTSVFVIFFTFACTCTTQARILGITLDGNTTAQRTSTGRGVTVQTADSEVFRTICTTASHLSKHFSPSPTNPLLKLTHRNLFSSPWRRWSLPLPHPCVIPCFHRRSLAFRHLTKDHGPGIRSSHGRCHWPCLGEASKHFFPLLYHPLKKYRPKDGRTLMVSQVRTRPT